MSGRTTLLAATAELRLAVQRVVRSRYDMTRLPLQLITRSICIWNAFGRISSLMESISEIRLLVNYWIWSAFVSQLSCNSETKFEIGIKFWKLKVQIELHLIGEHNYALKTINAKNSMK